MTLLSCDFDLLTLCLVSRMAVGDSGILGSSVTPPSESPDHVPESLCQSDPATVGIIVSSGYESVDVAKELKELRDSTKKLQDARTATDTEIETLKKDQKSSHDEIKKSHDEIKKLQDARTATDTEIETLKKDQKSSHDEIKKLQGDTSMLGLDVALIFAGQLLSRVLRYSNPPVFPGPCMIAIRNQWNGSHWGKNFVILMRKYFSTERQKQEKIATIWDVVLNQRHQAAHPDLLHNYNEQKAVQLIAILSRSPNPDELTKGILHVLVNRQIFLDAEPCPDLRKNKQGGA